MGRDFNGTSSYLTRTDALGITGYPISMFCWFKPDTSSGNTRTFIGLFEDNLRGSANQLKVGLSATGRLQSVTNDPTNGNRILDINSTVTAGVWSSCLAVYTSATSRALYLNGSTKNTASTTTAINFSVLNRFVIGATKENQVVQYADGQIMFATVWTASLGDDDALALHSGLIPFRVRPASVRGYWSIGKYYNV